MKTLKIIMILIFAAFVLIPPGFVSAADEPALKLKPNVSLDYCTTYWWRGLELFGKNVGVLWSSIGLDLGDTGLSLGFTLGLSQEYILNSDTSKNSYSDNEKAQRAQTEFDYILSYSKDLSKLVTLGATFIYAGWHLYNDANKTSTPPGTRYTDWSFLDFNLTAALKTILSPKLDVFYDYYPWENKAIKAAGKSSSQYEDYYIKLSFAQDIFATRDAFSFFVKTWIAYYNNAYLDRSGLSDLGLALGFKKDTEKASFKATIHYTRSLSKDFYRTSVYSNTEPYTGEVKNHLWASIGMLYNF
jgi:hypothetical protein